MIRNTGIELTYWNSCNFIDLTCLPFFAPWCTVSFKGLVYINLFYNLDYAWLKYQLVFYNFLEFLLLYQNMFNCGSSITPEQRLIIAKHFCLTLWGKPLMVLMVGKIRNCFKADISNSVSKLECLYTDSCVPYSP